MTSSNLYHIDMPLIAEKNKQLPYLTFWAYLVSGERSLSVGLLVPFANLIITIRVKRFANGIFSAETTMEIAHKASFLEDI